MDNLTSTDESSTSNQTVENVQQEAELTVEKQESSTETSDSESQREGQQTQGEEEIKATSVAMNDNTSEENSEEPKGNPDEDQEPTTEEIELDFNTLDKKEILQLVLTIKDESDGKKIDKILKPAKARFDELFHAERKSKLDAFLKEEGAEEDDFDYPGDDIDHSFRELNKTLRKRRNEYFKNLDKERESNLQIKNQILEDLRNLIDGEETNSSINAVRELQSQWKAVGPVPGNYNQTLWASYNALLDRFYDARSIYFELKDLDRKVNLGLKIKIVEQAEKLSSTENVQESIKNLNELHEEFRSIGPVPKDDQEPLWQRFKAASDVIYENRKEFLVELKKEQVANSEKKLALIEELKTLNGFTSDKISDWNKKTKEVQQLQDKWKISGSVPREQSKSINKEFWRLYKGFYNNKGSFFKELGSKREENLILKQELVAKVESLKESEDFDRTSFELKKLQNRWKEIGPVPEKDNQAIYGKFKAACDHFFEKLRANRGEQEKEHQINLDKKQEVLDKLHAAIGSCDGDLDPLYELVDEFQKIGFVPRNSVKKIQKKFDQVTNGFSENPKLTDIQKADFKAAIEISKIKSGPRNNGRVSSKEGSVRRQIEQLDRDINTYQTNMDFLANSKAADALKEDLNNKIHQSTLQMDALKRQLKQLRES